MTTSRSSSIALSAPEDGTCAAPREKNMPRKKNEEVYRFTTPSGVKVSIVARGRRGWFLNHRPSWSEVSLRHLLTKGSRDEAVRIATREVEELYRSHERGATPTLLSVAAELVVAKRREGRSPDYTRKIEEHLRCFIVPSLGADTPVGAITSKDLLRFKHELAASDLEPETCNRVLTSLRQIMKYAADPAGYIVEPALPRNFRSAHWKTRERWQILTPPQITEMLRLAPDEVRPLLGYVANTGLRIGTALATEVSWIDFAERRVRYPASAMKGRHAHVVDMGAAAEMFLKQALAVSPKKPFPYSYWHLLKRWMVLRKQLGRPRLRIHDLRHSFISNQLAAGTPAHVVQALAAHRSLAVTSLYAHPSDEARKAAADRVQVGIEETPRPDQSKAEMPATAAKTTRGSHLRVVK